MNMLHNTRQWSHCTHLLLCTLPHVWQGQSVTFTSCLRKQIWLQVSLLKYGCRSSMPALSSYTWKDRVGRRSLQRIRGFAFMRYINLRLIDWLIDNVIWVSPLRTSLTTELSANHSSLSPSFSTLPSFSNGFNLRSNSRCQFAAGLPGGRRCGCLSTSAGGSRWVRASSSTVDIHASSAISTSRRRLPVQHHQHRG